MAPLLQACLGLLAGFGLFFVGIAVASIWDDIRGRRVARGARPRPSRLQRRNRTAVDALGQLSDFKRERNARDRNAWDRDFHALEWNGLHLMTCPYECDCPDWARRRHA